MLFLQIVFEALAQTVVGMFATAAIVVLTWASFKPLKRPEWGPTLAFAILSFAYAKKLTNSPLLPMTLMMMLPASLAAWWEGYEWRRRRKLSKLFNIVAAPSRPFHRP